MLTARQFFHSKLADVLPQYTHNLCVSDVYVEQSNLLPKDWHLVYNQEVVNFICKDRNIRDLNKPVIKDLKFTAHKSVVTGLYFWYHNLKASIIAEFGTDTFKRTSYGLIYRLYFAMRNDLKLVVNENKVEINVVEKNSVSVIVTARNNAEFLADCLHSCWNQTARPIEVIYSDDGSTDNSLNVARDFIKDYSYNIPNVSIISYKHTGVVASRNRAVEASRGKILIHVDGDDILPSNFIEEHLKALNKNPNAPFVYGPAQAFGSENLLWRVPEWGRLFLWDQNFCNTSSAIRREVFYQIRGWYENITKTYWDWDLFLRASRLGAPAASEALLLYRQHDKSWSRTNGERKIKGLECLVRQQLARLSICCVYSGRLPKLLDKWMKSIVDNVGQISCSDVELIILDNSQSNTNCKDTTTQLWKTIEKYRSYFLTIRVLKLDGKAKRSEPVTVSTLLANAYTNLINLAMGELIFFIEDDIILPHKFALQLLIKEITSSDSNCKVSSVVSGAYRNRHKNTTNPWIAGYVEEDRVIEFQELPKEQRVKIHVAGTGCLLCWKYFLPKIIQPLFRGATPAHDWWMLDNTEREKYLLTNVVCRHYQTEKDFV